MVKKSLQTVFGPVSALKTRASQSDSVLCTGDPSNGILAFHEEIPLSIPGIIMGITFIDLAYKGTLPGHRTSPEELLNWREGGDHRICQVPRDTGPLCMASFLQKKG